MEPTHIESNLKEFRSKIKARWSRFTDQDLENVKTDLSQLSEKIQKVYGTAKDEAQKQVDEFKKAFRSETKPEATHQSKQPTVKPVSMPHSDENSYKKAKAS